MFLLPLFSVFTIRFFKGAPNFFKAATQQNDPHKIETKTNKPYGCGKLLKGLNLLHDLRDSIKNPQAHQFRILRWVKVDFFFGVITKWYFQLVCIKKAMDI
jgi:hypothetical protein